MRQCDSVTEVTLVTVVSGSHWPNPDRIVCVFDLSLGLFISRRLVLSHGLGGTHQGRVDLATLSAGESQLVYLPG